MSANILLLEDDYFLRDGLTELLTREGYRVSAARNCQEARKLLTEGGCQLLILDVMLPDGSGLELCTEVRNRGDDVPILFLTACDEEYQVVRGLDAGADDYVTKPFKLQEFLSRVRALLRRRKFAVLGSSEVSIDLETMSARKNGQELSLTPTEFQILAALLSSRGLAVTREALLQKIWDCDGNYIDDNTLSVHVSRLRDKIGAGHIGTVRGVGYRWEDST